MRGPAHRETGATDVSSAWLRRQDTLPYPRIPWRASALFPSLFDLLLGRAEMAVPILTLLGGQGRVIPLKSVPGGCPPGESLGVWERRRTLPKAPAALPVKSRVQPKYTREVNWRVRMQKDRIGGR